MRSFLAKFEHAVLEIIIFLLITGIILVVNLVPSEAVLPIHPLWDYYISGSGVIYDEDSVAVVDANDNYIYASDFNGTWDLDGTSGVDNHIATINNGHGFRANVFVSKYDSNGNYIWSRSYTNNSTYGGVHVNGIDVDSNGNVFIAGRFEETVDFDPTGGVDNRTAYNPSLNYYSDGFITKINADGTYGWTHTVGGGQVFDMAEDVSIDSNDNVIVVGHFQGPNVDFDPSGGSDLRSSIGGEDAFIWKFDNNGNYLWTGIIAGAGADNAYEVEVDSLDNIYVGGNFQATPDFDPGVGIYNRTSNGQLDTFVTKLDTNGNHLWTNTVGGTALEVIGDMEVDQNNHVYIKARVDSASVDFDPTGGTDIIAPGSYQPLFVSKYLSNSNYGWTNILRTDTGINYGDTGFYFDNSNNLIILGGFNGVSVDMNPTVGVDLKTSNTSADPFMSTFDSLTGGYISTLTYPRSGIFAPYAVEPASDDSPFFFGNGPFVSWVGKFSLDPLYQIANLAGGLDAENLSEQSIEVGSIYGSNSSNATVRLNQFSSARVIADIATDLSGGDQDWAGISISTDLVSHKVLLNYTSGMQNLPGLNTTFSLYVEVAGKSMVGVCPGVTTLADIYPTCPGLAYYDESDPNVSIVNINGIDYWKIDGLNQDVGAISREPAQIYNLDSSLDANTITGNTLGPNIEFGSPTSINSSNADVAISTSGSNYLIAEFTQDMTLDRDFTNISAGINVSEGKSFLSSLGAVPGKLSNLTTHYVNKNPIANSTQSQLTDDNGGIYGYNYQWGNSIDVSSTGQIAVVNYASLVSTSYYHIQLRIYDDINAFVSGVPSYGPIRVDQGGNTDTRYSPSVKYTNTGEVAVVWQDRRTAPNEQIYMRYFDTDGTALTNEILIADPVGNILVYDPKVDFDSNGNGLIVWGDRRSSIYQVYGQLIDSTHSLIGSNFLINTGISSVDEPAVASLSNDDFIVVWYESDNESVYGRRLDATGTFVDGSAFMVSELGTGYAGTSDNYAGYYQNVVGGANGDFAVVWGGYFDDGVDYYDRVYVQVFDSSLNKKISNEADMVVSDDDYQWWWDNLEIDANSQGEYIIAYDSSNGDEHVIYRRVNSDGTFAIPPTFIDETDGTKNTWGPSVSYYSDNAYVFTWNQEDGSSTDNIFGRLLSQGTTDVYSYVGVCPDAVDLNDVEVGCNNIYSLQESDNNVTVVDIDGVEYWRVSDLVGTGIFSSITDPAPPGPTPTDTPTPTPTPSGTVTTTPTPTPSPTNTVNGLPTLEIIEPNGEDDIAFDSYTIKWSDSDPNSNADIALFYDNNASGENGTQIVSGIKENNNDDEYEWDISGFEPGLYWVYGEIDDSTSQVIDYSEGPITIILGNCEEINNDANDDNDDTDCDGMTDLWETQQQLNPEDPTDSAEDPDEDGLTNVEEFFVDTDPFDEDTDNDGMPDGWEVDNDLDPLSDDSGLDPDNDSITNLDEFLGNTDPNIPNIVSTPTPTVTPTSQEFTDGQFDFSDLELDPEQVQTVLEVARSIAYVPLVITAATALIGIAPFLTQPNLLFAVIAALFVRRKDNHWGVVYDSLTRQPVPFAAVRLVNDTDSVTTVSDLKGRYSLVAPTGEYKLSVDHSDYDRFETKVSVDATRATNIDIPLIKSENSFIKIVISIKNILNTIVGTLGKFLFPLFFIYSVIAMLLQPNLLNMLVLLFYGVILAVMIRTNNQYGTKWGSVINTAFRDNVGGVFVRLAKNDGDAIRLLDTSISNRSGYYGFLVSEPGEYYVYANHPGFSFPASNSTAPKDTSGKFEQVRVGEELIINKNIKVDPKSGDLQTSEGVTNPFS